MFCEVPAPLFRKPTFLDILKALEKMDEDCFVRICGIVLIVLYLSYLLSDKTVGYEFDDEEEEESSHNEPDDESSSNNEQDEESSNDVKNEESSNDDKDEEESNDVKDEELLRFDTNDVKYDQAANILAFIYSCGLTMPDVEFPIKSWSITNKRINIKESSFMLKVKKYRQEPSENMKTLIRMRPSIRQLVEAYTYYSEAEERLSGPESISGPD